MVKVRYNGPSDELYFIDGKEYELVKIHKVNGDTYYSVIDEVGDPSFVTQDGFTIIEGTEEDVDWYETDKETLMDVLLRKSNRT